MDHTRQSNRQGGARHVGRCWLAVHAAVLLLLVTPVAAQPCAAAAAAADGAQQQQQAAVVPSRRLAQQQDAGSNLWAWWRTPHLHQQEQQEQQEQEQGPLWTWWRAPHLQQQGAGQPEQQVQDSLWTWWRTPHLQQQQGARRQLQQWAPRAPSRAQPRLGRRLAQQQPQQSAAAAALAAQQVLPKFFVSRVSATLVNTYSWSISRSASASGVAVTANGYDRQQIGYTLSYSRSLAKREFVVSGSADITNPSGTEPLTLMSLTIFVGSRQLSPACKTLPGGEYVLVPTQVLSCAFSTAFDDDPGPGSVTAFVQTRTGRKPADAPVGYSFGACAAGAGSSGCVSRDVARCVTVSDGTQLIRKFADVAGTAAAGNVSRSQLFAVTPVVASTQGPAREEPAVPAAAAPPSSSSDAAFASRYSDVVMPDSSWWTRRLAGHSHSQQRHAQQRPAHRQLLQAALLPAGSPSQFHWPIPQVTGARPPIGLDGVPANAADAPRELCGSSSFSFGMVFGPLLPEACGTFEMQSTAAAAPTDKSSAPIVHATYGYLQVLCPAPQSNVATEQARPALLPASGRSTRLLLAASQANATATGGADGGDAAAAGDSQAADSSARSQPDGEAATTAAGDEAAGAGETPKQPAATATAPAGDTISNNSSSSSSSDGSSPDGTGLDGSSNSTSASSATGSGAGNTTANSDAAVAPAAPAPAPVPAPLQPRVTVLSLQPVQLTSTAWSLSSTPLQRQLPGGAVGVGCRLRAAPSPATIAPVLTGTLRIGNPVSPSATGARTLAISSVRVVAVVTAGLSGPFEPVTVEADCRGAAGSGALELMPRRRTTCSFELVLPLPAAAAAVAAGNASSSTELLAALAGNVMATVAVQGAEAGAELQSATAPFSFAGGSSSSGAPAVQQVSLGGCADLWSGVTVAEALPLAAPAVTVSGASDSNSSSSTTASSGSLAGVGGGCSELCAAQEQDVVEALVGFTEQQCGSYQVSCVAAITPRNSGWAGKARLQPAALSTANVFVVAGGSCAPPAAGFASVSASGAVAIVQPVLQPAGAAAHLMSVNASGSDDSNSSDPAAAGPDAPGVPAAAEEGPVDSNTTANSTTAASNGTEAGDAAPGNSTAAADPASANSSSSGSAVVQGPAAASGSGVQLPTTTGPPVHLVLQLQDVRRVRRFAWRSTLQLLSNSTTAAAAATAAASAAPGSVIGLSGGEQQSVRLRARHVRSAGTTTAVVGGRVLVAPNAASSIGGSGAAAAAAAAVEQGVTVTLLLPCNGSRQVPANCSSSSSSSSDGAGAVQDGLLSCTFEFSGIDVSAAPVVVVFASARVPLPPAAGQAAAAAPTVQSAPAAVLLGMAPLQEVGRCVAVSSNFSLSPAAQAGTPLPLPPVPQLPGAWQPPQQLCGSNEIDYALSLATALSSAGAGGGGHSSSGGSFASQQATGSGGPCDLQMRADTQLLAVREEGSSAAALGPLVSSAAQAWPVAVPGCGR